MTHSIDWIGIIRSNSLFKMQRYPDNDIGLERTFTFPKQHMPHSPLELHIPEFHVCDENDEGVNFINITGMHHNSDADNPHSVEPACSQSVDQMTLCWATNESSSHLNSYGFDERVGVDIPDGVPNSSISWDKVLPQEPSTGKFYAYCPVLHRDGFPALIAFGGLKRWHKLGKLHRKGGRAAIRADYVMAMWFQNDQQSRVNGPSSILIEDYQEFYDNGNFCGYKYKSISEGWDRPLTQKPLFTTHPLSNRYFGDPQDEMFCMAEMTS